MKKYYVITYWFRSPSTGEEQSGIWMTDSLVDVGAYFAMVERYGGWCRCDV